MLSIGIVVGLLGYSLVFYGDQLWNGCTQNSLLNIMWPGGQKFIPCKPASGSGGGAGPNAPGSGQKTKTISPSGGKVPNVLGAHR